jgi:RNA polymerase sigma-70 factor (ECF subfamily)
MAGKPSSYLLEQWVAGNQEAAAELFERYASRLIAVAHARMSAQIKRRMDAEDVVLSAYRSFFAGSREGRFQVEHGVDLWRLLVSITLHKLYRQVKRHGRLKRAVRREQKLLDLDARLLAQEPSPLEAVALVDEVEQVMRRLEPLQRRMLEMRLQGHTLFEIARATQRTERTVRRLLERVRQELQPDADDQRE